MTSEIVIATHNPGKVTEIRDLLSPYFSVFHSAGDLGLPEPEETGDTFTENALIKSRSAAKHSGKLALADDSGLSVEALGGAPGIYSARWAGPDKDFFIAMNRVNEALAEFENKRAAFICVLALSWPDGRERTYEGRVDGHIMWPPRGDKGFGYDPIFVPEGHQVTFAEMEPDHKHKISHRAQAFKALIKDDVLRKI